VFSLAGPISIFLDFVRSVPFYLTLIVHFSLLLYFSWRFSLSLFLYLVSSSILFYVPLLASLFFLRFFPFFFYFIPLPNYVACSTPSSYP